MVVSVEYQRVQAFSNTQKKDLQELLSVPSSTPTESSKTFITLMKKKKIYGNIEETLRTSAKLLIIETV